MIEIVFYFTTNKCNNNMEVIIENNSISIYGEIKFYIFCEYKNVVVFGGFWSFKQRWVLITN